MSKSAWHAELDMRTRAMDLILLAGSEAFKRGDFATSRDLMEVAERIQRLVPKSPVESGGL